MCSPQVPQSATKLIHQPIVSTRSSPLPTTHWAGCIQTRTIRTMGEWPGNLAVAVELRCFPTVPIEFTLISSFRKQAARVLPKHLRTSRLWSESAPVSHPKRFCMTDRQTHTLTCQIGMGFDCNAKPHVPMCTHHTDKMGKTVEYHTSPHTP